eukprot:10814047-Heterocapsa_arctica.AAC.2
MGPRLPSNPRIRCRGSALPTLCRAGGMGHASSGWGLWRQVPDHVEVVTVVDLCGEAVLQGCFAGAYTRSTPAGACRE